jgi:hypothetical protein
MAGRLLNRPLFCYRQAEFLRALLPRRLRWEAYRMNDMEIGADCGVAGVRRGRKLATGRVAAFLFRAGLLIAGFACGVGAPMGAKAQTVKPHMSYGTAFAVTEDGDLVTNEHVVSGCTSVDAQLGPNQLSGEVSIRDQTNDLAIVRLRQKSPHFAVLRSLPELRAGDSVITYGFPLPGMLALEGNLTIGYVSALRGALDNPNYIQITTPIQPGSSGGALLDTSGHVIGVVAKRLNPGNSFQTAGEMPQLANFAVGLDMLRHFLNKNKIPLTERDSKQELRPADVGDQARLFSYSIRCVPNDAVFMTAVPAEIPNGTKPAAGVAYERAVLFEEDPANAWGRSFAGSVTWRVETLPPEAGRSPEMRLLGDIRIPGHVHAVLTIGRNSGADGQTNHRFEITFDTTESPHGDIVSAPGILMKLSERAQGIPIMVRTTPTRPGSFVLSGIEGHNQQNLKLLKERAWFDLPIVYRDGRRAIVALAKGTSGLRAFNEALID